MSESRKYRLITRSDMDGLVCATLIRYLGLADEILFAHPKDMQDRKIAVGPKDIITNLPYVPGAHLCIDHHLSETLRSPKRCDHVIDPRAPSAARVVFNHFGGFQRFPKSFEAMMAAVDRADSGSFTLEEVLHPRGWALLSFIMDGRTGLGRFKDFRISHDQLMRDLIGYCGRLPIEEIMQLPDVRERVETYFSYEALFKAQLQDHARVDKTWCCWTCGGWTPSIRATASCSTPFTPSATSPSAPSPPRRQAKPCLRWASRSSTGPPKPMSGP